MNRYEEGLKLIEDSCGNGKDNIIALSTIAIELSSDGKPYPCVREVDAYYENGVFYVTTTSNSVKMQQIVKNSNIAFVVSFDGISGSAEGENLGWVLDPENAEIRTKLREAFKDWYDHANDEKDKKCIILALRIKRVFIFRDHGAVRYNLDFVNELELGEG